MDGRFNLDNPTVLRAFGIQAGPPKKKEDTRHKKADMGDYARIPNMTGDSPARYRQGRANSEPRVSEQLSHQGEDEEDRYGEEDDGPEIQFVDETRQPLVPQDQGECHHDRHRHHQRNHHHQDQYHPGGGGDYTSLPFEETLDSHHVSSRLNNNNNTCMSGRYWCVSDCCGIVCVVVTWLLVAYAEFVVTMVILGPQVRTSTGRIVGHVEDDQETTSWSLYGVVNLALFQAFAILALSSHTRTMLTDPGAVPRGNATRENITRMGYKEGQVIYKCSKCCSIKPDRAHHCSVCQRCIRKMDHHCPWVNNCVGENNQKYFVLFTLYIASMSFHALFLAINHCITCMTSEFHACPAYSPPATMIFLLFLMFEGLLFALFTSIMFGTQVAAIWHDQTGIESLKKEEARWVRKSRWKSIQAVFGRFSIQWFSPFAKIPPPSKSHGYLFSV